MKIPFNKKINRFNHLLKLKSIRKQVTRKMILQKPIHICPHTTANQINNPQKNKVLNLNQRKFLETLQNRVYKVYKVKIFKLIKLNGLRKMKKVNQKNNKFQKVKIWMS
jgi:hypothetical protein